MRIKPPDTRNYGKDHPRYEQEKSVTRAGEDDSALRNALDQDLWFSKKDPYSKQDEVDPPKDWDDEDFNKFGKTSPRDDSEA